MPTCEERRVRFSRIRSAFSTNPTKRFQARKRFLNMSAAYLMLSSVKERTLMYLSKGSRGMKASSPRVVKNSAWIK